MELIIYSGKKMFVTERMDKDPSYQDLIIQKQ